MSTTVILFIVPCVAHFSDNNSTQLFLTSPSFSLSKGEGAVLHCKSKRYNFHIIYISLLNIFEDSINNLSFRKAGSVRCSSPPSEERLGEEALIHLLHKTLPHIFRSIFIKLSIENNIAIFQSICFTWF